MNNRLTPAANSSVNGEGALRVPPESDAALPETVSPSDMELLQAFQQDVTVAQRAFNSLMAQFAGRYKLKDGDRVDLDGSIVRQE